MARRRRSTPSTVKYFRNILESWGADVAEKGKRVLKEGADEVVAEAKANCPVKTGKLRDSIKAEKKFNGMYYTIMASAIAEKKRKVRKTDEETNETVMVEEDYDYARIVEYHPDYGKPFLIPARDAHSKQIQDGIEAAVDKAIKESNRERGH